MQLHHTYTLIMWHDYCNIPCDAPLSSLMDSTASPKVNTMEREGLGARSLARSTSRVEGHAKAPRWD